MYKLCQTEHAARRQRELEKGLLQMMQKYRYEDISVSDLCKHLQVPRKTFYRYFSDKDGALYALIDHTLGDFFDKSVSDGKSRGNALDELEMFFDFWYENKAFLDALERSGLSGILVERANAVALEEGYMPSRFKTVPTQVQGLVLSFTVCGLLSMVLRWHHQGFLFTPAEMTKFAVTLLTNPLISGK